MNLKDFNLYKLDVYDLVDLACDLGNYAEENQEYMIIDDFDKIVGDLENIKEIVQDHFTEEVSYVDEVSIINSVIKDVERLMDQKTV
jgi:hypothetical protein